MIRLTDGEGLKTEELVAKAISLHIEERVLIADNLPRTISAPVIAIDIKSQGQRA